MNTYGLFAVNQNTFNISPEKSQVYPKVARKVIVTFLKVHNLTLNVLGYIPGINIISGCVRIGIGAVMVLTTLCIGSPNAKKGPIIGPFYWEALLTGIAQVARGAFEALVPFGWIVNASLDGIFTIYNPVKVALTTASRSDMVPSDREPYPNPDYLPPFWLLYLV